MSRRWREIAVAGHTGDIDVARTALHDPDPVARELALGALRRLESLSDDDVRAALADADAPVRRRAALIAVEHPGVSLLEALADPDPAVVEAAAFACGERTDRDDAELERLIELGMHATDPLVREAAIAALGAIGDIRGLPAILSGCVDKPAIRRRAVLALAPFDGPEVDAVLAAALQDRDWQVRQAAEDLLR
jgi:HEAT repeat protein